MSKPTTAELVEYLRTQAEAVFDNSSDFECRDMFIAAADRLEDAEAENKQYKAAWSVNIMTKRIKELEDALTKGCEDMNHQFPKRTCGLVDKYEATIKKVRPYIQHHGNCPAESTGKNCDCGLQAILEQP